MKIELKLNLDSLLAVSQVINKVYEFPPINTERERIYISIGFDIADKFESKTKSQIKKQGLFDQNKLHKITLKYHEAWALKGILIEFIETIKNPYQKNLVQKVINTIDQKTV